jgi:hypothetical protein
MVSLSLQNATGIPLSGGRLQLANRVEFSSELVTFCEAFQRRRCLVPVRSGINPMGTDVAGRALGELALVSR